jgi:hypothetical protein
MAVAVSFSFSTFGNKYCIPNTLILTWNFNQHKRSLVKLKLFVNWKEYGH